MKKIYLTICGLLSLTLIFGQSLTQLDESFETVNGATYVPDGWISVDDGDAYPWRQLSDGKARTGAAYVGTGGYSGGGSPSNDWLITPKLKIQEGSKLTFWYRAGGASWPDTITVNISKTGTSEGDFTITLDTVGTASEEYAEFSYVLTDNEGISDGDEVYVGLNYIGSGWYICLDDLSFTPPPAPDTLNESFETVNGITWVPEGWISVDDGDGYPWRQLTDGKARTGSAYVGTGGYSGGGSPSNDWLITTKLTVREGSTLKFWYRAGGASWPDTITVNISKTGTSEGDFTITLDTVGTASEEYAEFSYVLTDNEGISDGDEVYIGLNYIGSGWYICLDDLSVEPPAAAPETLNESFEVVDTVTYVPVGWLSVDDGDGYPWRRLSDGKARTGEGYVGTGPYYPAGGGETNDWMVTTKLTVAEGYVFSFWYRAGGATWPDTITVNISKTGTSEEDFTITLDTVGTNSEEYAKYTYILSDHPDISPGDKIYIGINYIGSGWYICLDDFRLGEPEGPDPKDASLSDLTLDGTTIYGFRPDKLDYYVDSTQDASAVPKADATATNPAASVVITDAGSLTGNTTVEVTSEDQSVTRTYTIHFGLFVTVFAEGFETADTLLPAGWTVIDQDADDLSWYKFVGDAMTDSSAAMCYSYTAEASNDWLISPAVPVREGSRLSFYAKVGGSTWPEYMVVMASKTNDQMASFNIVIDSIKAFASMDYVRFEYILTDHQSISAGDEIYLAFQRYTTFGYYILLDDIWVAVPLKKAATLSDLKVNGTTIAGFDPDILEYTVAVSAVPTITAIPANNAITPEVTLPPSVPGFATVSLTSEDQLVSLTYLIELTISDGINPDLDASSIDLYPQPATDYIFITNLKRSEVRFYDLTGKIMKQVRDLDGETCRIDLTDLEEGTYIVRIQSGKETTVKKLFVIR